MSDRISFADVNRAVLAVDKMQQQIADLTKIVDLLSERLAAPPIAAPPAPSAPPGAVR